MTMMSNLASAMIVLSLPGCGSWLGNPKKPTPTTAQVQIQVRSDLSSSNQGLTEWSVAVTSGSGSVVASLVFTDIRMVLQKIELDGSAGDTALAHRAAGPYIADLLANTLTPIASINPVQPGLYTSVDLDLGILSATAGAPQDPLVGSGLYATGALHFKGGNSKNLTVKFADPTEFSLPLSKASLGGIVILPDEIVPIILSFQVSKWFIGIGDSLLAMATPDINLDGSGDKAAVTAWNALKHNVEGDAELDRDEQNGQQNK